MSNSFKIREKKIIIKTKGILCDNAEELINSSLFKEVIHLSLEYLKEKSSIILKLFQDRDFNESLESTIIELLKKLVVLNIDDAVKIVPNSDIFLENKEKLFDYVEFLYNFWRDFDRFIISESSEGLRFDRRPYRTFNNTVEQLTHLIRKIYRDIQENISNNHPNVYRQIRAGAQFAAISNKKNIPLPPKYKEKLKDIGIIRQILINPPVVLEPPINKRQGTFIPVEKDLISLFDLNEEEWLCFPAKVGPLVILAYVHEKFYELGFSLGNLFEIVDDTELTQKPDGIYLFGVPEHSLDNLGEYSTVFYEDREEDIIIGAVPRDNIYGYFGYLKKMLLTIHNVIMLRRGRMPFHGSLTQIHLKSNKTANILLIGDTGTGKSETLEAFRNLGNNLISDIIIIADDMGSLSIGENGEIIGYGTEIGAFLRLDDLKPSTSFGAIDRAIFMNVDQVNSRIVIPVTNLREVLKGVRLDFVLYANNYEEIDEEHPILERFSNIDTAIEVFRQGKAMSKGTTTATGLVSTYFVNPFGVSSYKELNEKIARKIFTQLFENDVFVGQFRTRLGIKGMEMKGPLEAAKALIELIK